MVRTTTCSCIEPARSCNSALECLFTKANRFSGVRSHSSEDKGGSFSKILQPSWV